MATMLFLRGICQPMEHGQSVLRYRGKRVFSISQSAFNDNRLYTKNHEWIMVDRGTMDRLSSDHGIDTAGGENGSKVTHQITECVMGTVGITDYAQKHLGDVVDTKLAKVGMHLSCGESAGVIDSVKSTWELCAPMSGNVVANNDELGANPELVNSSCYEQGWLYKMMIDNEKELDKLMSEKDYNEFKLCEENKGDETQHF